MKLAIRFLGVTSVDPPNQSIRNTPTQQSIIEQRYAQRCGQQVKESKIPRGFDDHLHKHHRQTGEMPQKTWSDYEERHDHLDHERRGDRGFLKPLAQLYYHGGLICARLGQRKQAENLLKTALSINPHFSITGAEVIRNELAALATQPATSPDYSPELLNRIDEIIVFNPLGNEELRSIAALLIEDVNLSLLERNLRVDVNDEAQAWLLGKADTDSASGARPLRRAIQRYLQDAISDILIEGRSDEFELIEVCVENDRLDFKTRRGALAAERT